MLKNVFFLLLLSSLVIACKQVKNQFGEQISAKGAISYDEMLVKMGQADSISAKVTGVVTSVCQTKGCWMTIASTDPSKPEMTVTFKDYGFFMPKDCSGRKVIIDGFAKKEVISVDELRHYAEDAGKSKEEIAAINQPEEELRFEARGVILLDK